MNEQDTAAADAILLLEVEEKVNMRIAQVINDMLWGHKNSIMSSNYESQLNLMRNQLINITRGAAKEVVKTARIEATY